MQNIFNNINDKPKYRMQKVNRILHSDHIEYLKDSVYASIASNSSYDDLNTLNEYMTYVFAKIYSRLETLNEFETEAKLAEFFDFQNALIMQTMKCYNKTNNLFNAIIFFVKQCLHLLYNNVEFFIDIINFNSVPDSYNYLITIEPICYNKDDKISNIEETKDFVEDNIDIFSYNEKANKSIELNFIASELWIANCEKLYFISRVAHKIDICKEIIYNNRIDALRDMELPIPIDISKYEYEAEKAKNSIENYEYNDENDEDSDIIDGESEQTTYHTNGICGCAKYEEAKDNILNYYDRLVNYLYININKLDDKINISELTPIVPTNKFNITENCYKNYTAIKDETVVNMLRKTNHKKIDKILENNTNNTIAKDIIDINNIETIKPINGFYNINSDNCDKKTFAVINEFKDYVDDTIHILNTNKQNIDIEIIKKISRSFNKVKINRVVNKDGVVKIYSLLNNKNLLFTFTKNCDKIDTVQIKEKENLNVNL